MWVSLESLGWLNLPFQLDTDARPNYKFLYHRMTWVSGSIQSVSVVSTQTENMRKIPFKSNLYEMAAK